MLNKPLKVGITGGIGAGKTTVAKVFRTLGIPVYNSDLRARELMNSKISLKSSITDLLGPSAYDSEGGLNRPWVAKKVFGDASLLKNLNQLVHPVVRTDFSEWAVQYAHKPYVLQESALVFENDLDEYLDQTVLVIAPLDLRIERIQKRDPERTKASIADIINNQLGDEIKMARADYVINNDAQQFIIEQVLSVHNQLLTIS